MGEDNKDKFIDDLNLALKEYFDYVPIFKVVSIADAIIEKGWKIEKKE